MPEHYEVSRIRDYLLSTDILNKKIESMLIPKGGERIFKEFPGNDVRSFFVGNTIINIKTKAKYTLFICEKGSMLMHYRFTGIPHVSGYDYGDKLNAIYSLPIDKKSHVRFILKLKNTNTQFIYSDTRCLSHVILKNQAKNFDDFDQTKRIADDLECFKSKPYMTWRKSIEKRNIDLKTYLLDQSLSPSGIGNYLACEILFESKLNPWKKCVELSKKNYNKLWKAVEKIKSYCKSTSEYDWFKVYKVNSCKSCGHSISRQPHKMKSSQSTYFCEYCQR